MICQRKVYCFIFVSYVLHFITYVLDFFYITLMINYGYSETTVAEIVPWSILSLNSFVN